MAMNKTKEALADFTTVISMDADNVAEACMFYSHLFLSPLFFVFYSLHLSSLYLL